jgi:ketosteroid isomerase-like protein
MIFVLSLSSSSTPSGNVVVVGRFRGKAKNGAILDAPFVHIYRVRNGKAVFFQNYVDATPWANAWGG